MNQRTFSSRLSASPLAFGLAAMLLTAGPLLAEVRLANPFSSHGVLQREMKVPIWGTAEPGEAVTVAFAGQKKSAKADTAGKWRVDLDAMPAATKGRTFKVTRSFTSAPHALDDILVGEVWLASGQSNMDFTVAKREEYHFAGVNIQRVKLNRHRGRD